MKKIKNKVEIMEKIKSKSNKVKIKLSQIFNISSLNGHLFQLMEMDFPRDISFRISRNADLLLKEDELIQKTIKKYRSEFGEKDEETGNFIVKESSIEYEKFIKAVGELLETEIEIELDLLSRSIFKVVKPSMLLRLNFMFLDD